MLGFLGTIIFLAGSICALAAAVCWIIILLAAFQEDGYEGILCLCVPFYILYYAIARYEGEKKNLLIAVGLGCGILGGILQAAGSGLMEVQRSKRNMVRLAERDVQRTEKFKTMVSSAYKLFSEGIAEENHIKLEIASNTLSSKYLTDFVKDHPDMDADKSIESLAKTMNKFAKTYQRTLADRSRIAAGATRYLSEEDLEPKIKDIKSSFKKLDEALDLDLKL